MFRLPVLHPPNERLLIHAGPVTSIITHIIIRTYEAERRSQETTEETVEAVEEATAATADPVVVWARGASSQQVGQDRWRQGRSDNDSIGQGTLGCVKSYSGDQGKSGKIGEGHGTFRWPLQLRHVRSIIPLNIVLLRPPIRPASCYVHFDLSRMLKSGWYVFFMPMSFYAITNVSKNVPFFSIFASRLLRFWYWLHTI